MSKNKGNKNDKKEKATDKKKVLSDYQSRSKKNKGAVDELIPKTGKKAVGDGKEK